MTTPEPNKEEYSSEELVLSTFNTNKELNQLKVAANSLNQRFSEIGMNARQIEERVGETAAITEMNYSFDRAGKKFYKNQDIHKNYEAAPYFFKWTQLPYCKRTVKKKCQFWLASAPVLSFSWIFFSNMRSGAKQLRVPFRAFVKYGLIIGGLGCALALAQSLLFDQYCDIDSFHYIPDADRLSLSRKLRQQYNKIEPKKKK